MVRKMLLLEPATVFDEGFTGHWTSHAVPTAREEFLQGISRLEIADIRSVQYGTQEHSHRHPISPEAHWLAEYVCLDAAASQMCRSSKAIGTTSNHYRIKHRLHD